MYGNIKSLCCVPGTNSVIGQLYFKNRQTLVEKETRFMVARDGEWVGGWMEVVKRYKLPVIR